jgi:hypothetical protein
MPCGIRKPACCVARRRSAAGFSDLQQSFSNLPLI